MFSFVSCKNTSDVISRSAKPMSLFGRMPVERDEEEEEMAVEVKSSDPQPQDGQMEDDENPF
jgi:hypothetical protein